MAERLSGIDEKARNWRSARRENNVPFRHATRGKFHEDLSEREVITEELSHLEEVQGIKEPLTREEFEQMIENFLADKKQLLLESVLRLYSRYRVPMTPTEIDETNTEENFDNNNENDEQQLETPDSEKVKEDLIESFDLNNKVLERYGLPGRIRWKKRGYTDDAPRWRVYAHDPRDADSGELYYFESDTDGGKKREDLAAIMSAAFIKANFESRNSGFRNNFTGADLNEADFGNKVWNQESKQLENGETKNLEMIFRTVQRRMGEIISNVSQLTPEQQKYFLTNEDTYQMVLQAVPYDKFMAQINYRGRQWARSLQLISDDPTADYRQLVAHPEMMNDALYTDEQKNQRSKMSLLQTKVWQGQPVFIPHEKYDYETHEQIVDRLRQSALSSAREFLAVRAANQESEETAMLFDEHRCTRGPASPYFYHDYQVYDLIQAVGWEMAAIALESNDTRDTSRLMEGWKLLEPMHINWEKSSGRNLKVNLEVASAIQNNGLWQYMQEAHPCKQQTDEEWCKRSERWQARRNFFQAKEMYFLAKKIVNLQQPDMKFHVVEQGIPWQRLDTKDRNIDEVRLHQAIQQHPGIWKSFVFDVNDVIQAKYFDDKEGEEIAKLSISTILDLLDKGSDLSSLALSMTPDKQAQMLLEDKFANQQQARETAMQSWDETMQENASDDELTVFLENINEYLVIDKNLMLRWLRHKQTMPEEIAALPVDKKSDLDFKFGFMDQLASVREYFLRLSNKVGVETAKKYLQRFQAMIDSDRFANWHDSLYWTEHADQLSDGELKAIISSVNTMDENHLMTNLIRRYRRDEDDFQARGQITSVRELQTRVQAIENGINLQGVPAEILEITSAPGFDYRALKKFRKEKWFQDLHEGKLDGEQPFTPIRRDMTERDLGVCVKEAVGVRSENIAGTADDPKKLFKQLNDLLKQNRQPGKEQLRVQDLFTSVPAELYDEVLQLLREQHVDVGTVLTATVHAKSDPEGWVCGNYTDCCMPFGQSRNTDYMTNKATQYFTVKNSNGRIIAQSVMVDSYDKRNNEPVIVLDNIEVARNATELMPALAKVYSEFWSDYTDKPVRVGTTINDLIPLGAKLVDNYCQHKTNLEYSDSRSRKVYDIPKLENKIDTSKILVLGNITQRDVKTIAQIEKAVYPEDMVQGEEYIADILRRARENEVPGAATSFYVRQGKEIAGYTLLLPEASEFQTGAQAAHVYDMATLPKYRGGKVMFRMWEQVIQTAQTYQLPIEAEARGSTTYALLENPRVIKWLEKRGMRRTQTKKMPQYLGDEDFYLVRLETTGG